MADTKLTALDALAALSADDLFYVVNDPAGTPSSKSVTADALRKYTSTYSAVLAASGGDYTTLADAVAALGEGDVLFIRNGTYAGGATIATNKITVIGESRDGVILQSPNATTPCLTVTGAHVALRNLKVDGQYDNGSGTPDAQTWAGIYVTGDHAAIDNVHVFETYGHGISLVGAQYARVANCIIENRATNGVTAVAGGYQAGVRIEGGGRCQVLGNLITGWSSAVALAAGSHECVVAMNKAVANYGYTDAGHTATADVLYDSGGTTGNANNIWHANEVTGAVANCIGVGSGVDGCMVLDNVLSAPNIFSDDDGYGIAVTTGDATAPTLNVVLQGNILYGAGAGERSTGMTGSTRGGLVVRGNTFEGCDISGVAAVNITGALTEMVFAENNFLACDGGLAVSALAAHILDNVITKPGGTQPCIAVSGGDAQAYVISGNNFDANGVACVGIQIASTAGDYHRVVQNTLKGFAAAALDLNRGHCIVEMNYFVSTATTGALVISNAAAVGNLVHDNFVDCNDGDAILLNAGVTHNIITRNRLIGAAAALNDSSGNATNQTTTNHHDGYSAWENLKALGAQTVGASQATIAHGLGYTPTEVQITMTSAGRIWKSAASDATNIYLTADDADRTAEVFVR